MAMDTPKEIRRRFCKDFKLPIHLFGDPYYSYFVNLYDKEYGISEKTKWLLEAVSVSGGSSEFFEFGERVSESVKKIIESTQAYAEFNAVDMERKYPLSGKVKQQNIYIEPNVGKMLISIDLKKANFNCLNEFGLHDELGIKSYEDLIRKTTDLKYYAESKTIRQNIFGHLNPSRQQRLQKHVIDRMCGLLIKAGAELSSASSDEIIIRSGMKIGDVKEVLEVLPPRMKFYRVEEFSFNRVSPNHDFFIKTICGENGERRELKNVPGHLFAQVYPLQP